jgi:hypothetical protein
MLAELMNYLIKIIFLSYGIVVTFYGCDCGLKKVVFTKSIFSWDWFDIYICLVKTMVEIEVEQKVV